MRTLGFLTRHKVPSGYSMSTDRRMKLENCVVKLNVNGADLDLQKAWDTYVPRFYDPTIGK